MTQRPTDASDSGGVTMKLLYTVDEAAQALSLGRTVLYDLLKRKQLYSVKVGRSRRVPLKSLQTFVEQLVQV